VKDKVSADYIEGERRKRFIELGKTAKAGLEARIKAGDTLEQAAPSAATGSGLKLEVKAVAPFALRTRPQDLDYAVLGALERLEKGQVSDMIFSGEKGIFVFAADKQLPDLTEASPRYAETRNQIAGYTARLGASAYLTELVERELKKTTPQAQ
jgi:peptidyl-prolyl cis-trans isomerase D